jgi:hypothetical protein
MSVIPNRIYRSLVRQLQSAMPDDVQVDSGASVEQASAIARGYTGGELSECKMNTWRCSGMATDGDL